ncbi:hypothetical protein QYF61_016861 [Mycteria americana]|uniref:Uncharacterized protein n=1 Tax=Mycteria americana TaxID=33587 RepID=A0AAN7RU12_MYCAM|nr:hypothetical protein QYF61_016861 [Mycteria americana]
MSDFDSNPFADPDLNNPFKVRLGAAGAVSLPRCRGGGRAGCADPRAARGRWGPRAFPRCVRGGRSLPREVGKGRRCRVALASGVWRAGGRWPAALEGAPLREAWGMMARRGSEKNHVAKARLEFRLASTVKNNKKGFFKCVNRKRSIRDNIGLLLDEVGHLTNGDVNKAEMFNQRPSSPLSLTMMMGPGIPGVL